VQNANFSSGVSASSSSNGSVGTTTVSSTASSGNPANYVVSVSQSKKYLFSFMIKSVEDTVLLKHASFADGEGACNAYINVIDIMRE